MSNSNPEPRIALLCLVERRIPLANRPSPSGLEIGQHSDRRLCSEPSRRGGITVVDHNLGGAWQPASHLADIAERHVRVVMGQRQSNQASQEWNCPGQHRAGQQHKGDSHYPYRPSKPEGNGKKDCLDSPAR